MVAVRFFKILIIAFSYEVVKNQHFQMYSFGREGGRGSKKMCTHLIMLTILDDPLVLCFTCEVLLFHQLFWTFSLTCSNDCPVVPVECHSPLMMFSWFCSSVFSRSYISWSFNSPFVSTTLLTSQSASMRNRFTCWRMRCWKTVILSEIWSTWLLKNSASFLGTCMLSPMSLYSGSRRMSTKPGRHNELSIKHE